MAEEDYMVIREQQEAPTDFEDGFGLKAMLGGLFVAFLVLPGSLYMFLMLGQQLGQAAVWVTLIIFLEITKRCRATLTRQEMFVLNSVTMGIMLAGASQFFNFVWMQYFVRSDAASQFEIVHRIPFWQAPPPGSQAYVQRNLLHRDWWPYLALMALGIVWNRLSFFSLGYVMFRLTSDVEKLPYPIAPITAQGIMALAESEEETWRWRCFSVGSTVGIVFGLVYAGIPIITGIFLREPIYLIPIPFYDFTTTLQDVKIFRAVPLALNTNLYPIFLGFALPFWMVMGTFAAGVGGRLLLNPILYRLGMLRLWEPGFDYIETGMANYIDFWMSFVVGTGIAVAIIGIIVAVRQAMRVSRERQGTERGILTPPRGRGDIPIPVAILFYVAKTTWVIMLCHWLVPKFPIWILVGFGFGYTPLMTYVSTRLIGLTGNQVGIPWVREGSFVLSGYKGVDIWYAPIPLGDAARGAQNFRICELTGTKFTSIYKAEFFMIPVAVGASIFFWSFIYKMSDIPEDYPWAMRFWERDSVIRAIWMSATTTGNAFFLRAFKLPVVGAGLVYVLAAYPIMRLLGAPTLFIYGTITGLAGDPMNAFPLFLGAMLGRYYMAKVFGPEQWRRYTPVLAAGFGCGISLVSMACVAARLIASAVTTLPF